MAGAAIQFHFRFAGRHIACRQLPKISCDTRRAYIGTAPPERLIPRVNVVTLWVICRDEPCQKTNLAAKATERSTAGPF